MRSSRSLRDFSRSAALALCMLAAAPGARAAQDCVGILLFKAEAVPASYAAALHSQLAPPEGRRDAGSLAYAYERGPRVTPGNLARYEEICDAVQCGLLLMGRIYARGGGLFIEAKIFSREEKAFLCALTGQAPGGAVKKAGAVLSRRVSLFIEGDLPVVSNLKISGGSFPDKVSLSWTCNTGVDFYTVSRSFYENGPYTRIGETKSTSFVDTTAEEGFKYWYTVSPAPVDPPGVPATGIGYRKPPVPRSLTMNDLLDGHTREWPEPATPSEAEREKRHLTLYEKYYESYFMMTFIILVGRMYVDSGELLAYRELGQHGWDPANRTIYFSRPGLRPIKFFSRRFFRFLRDMHQSGIGIYELLPRVIANGVLFCVRSGDREYRLPDGRYRYVPDLEAVGLATEYHRDYKKWKSNSIVFATSDDDLYRRIREAQMKGH